MMPQTTLLSTSTPFVTGRADPQAKLLILQVLYRYCKEVHSTQIEWLESLVADSTQLTVEKFKRLHGQLQRDLRCHMQDSLLYLEINAYLEVFIQQYKESIDNELHWQAFAEQFDLFLQRFLTVLNDKIEQSTRVPAHRKENIKAIFQLLQVTYPNTDALFLTVIHYLYQDLDTRWLVFAGQSQLKTQLLQAIFSTVKGLSPTASPVNEVPGLNRAAHSPTLTHVQVVHNMWETIQSIEKQDRQARIHDQQEIMRLREQLQLQQNKIEVVAGENQNLRVELEALQQGAVIDEQSKSLHLLLSRSV